MLVLIYSLLIDDNWNTKIHPDFHLLFQSQAKFCLERAQEGLDWLSAVTERTLEYEEGQLKDQGEFANLLKDGILLCE